MSWDGVIGAFKNVRLSVDHYEDNSISKTRELWEDLYDYFKDGSNTRLEYKGGYILMDTRKRLGECFELHMYRRGKARALKKSHESTKKETA